MCLYTQETLHLYHFFDGEGEGGVVVVANRIAFHVFFTFSIHNSLHKAQTWDNIDTLLKLKYMYHVE
jgi:hypothetical protein